MDAPTRATPGSFSFATSMADITLARSGDPEAKGAFTMRGHAAVFNRLSHDLGGFKTRIKPGFFDNVLDSHPDVHLNREHDMRMLLARTKNGSLELRPDPYGLHVWARLSKTALAEETATLMQDGVLDQMSFACDIGSDTWTEDQDGLIVRDLYDCAGLYDAAICAQGAFPQTSAELVASFTNASEAFDLAKAEGRIVQPEPKGDSTISVPADVSFTADTNLEVAPETVGQEKDSIAQPDAEGVSVVAASEQGERDLAAFRAACEERFTQLTS